MCSLHVTVMTKAQTSLVRFVVDLFYRKSIANQQQVHDVIRCCRLVMDLLRTCWWFVAQFVFWIDLLTNVTFQQFWLGIWHLWCWLMVVRRYVFSLRTQLKLRSAVAERGCWNDQYQDDELRQLRIQTFSGTLRLQCIRNVCNIIRLFVIH